MTFDGFPRECLTFLEQLQANNTREWFEAHKADYEAHVLQPSRAFVVALGERLRAEVPGVIADPKVNRSLFRLQRDTRFSQDKAPYKTNLGVWLWEGERGRMECSGFYVHLEPQSFLLGVGIYMFDKNMLHHYREAVDDREFGEALAAAVAQVEGAGLRLWGDHYKRVPQGYPADHPRARLLKFNGLTAGLELSALPDELWTPQAVEHCAQTLLQALPLHLWLRELVEHL